MLGNRVLRGPSGTPTLMTHQRPECDTYANVPNIGINIPPEVFKDAEETIGAFFEPISHVPRKVVVGDHLNTQKSLKRAEILQRYAPLRSKKLLEIGSGFGTNLAVWMTAFGVDGYGLEADSIGFGSSFSASRTIFAANGLDPTRIVDGDGEELPFEDESFDVVYSANVLEHTESPERVLSEAFRVLRRGGLCHMEMPNFLSYFEGHYMVVQPPLLWEWMLPFWVRCVFGRDPAFARTLHTRINPLWCRRMVRELDQVYGAALLSLGEDIFLERFGNAFSFETQVVAGKLKSLILFMQRLNIGNWMGRSIVGLKGHYPIYLSMLRTERG